MRAVIVERGILSICGGHVLWTGLVGAALWRVRGDQPFRTDMLTDPRFLRVLVICMIMHGVWDAPFELPLYGKYIVLGLAAWLLILAFIQSGLKQIREAQASAGTTGAATRGGGAPDAAAMPSPA
jgi:RsiW-degrading membrane proteinase PrsW (M82 family)